MNHARIFEFARIQIYSEIRKMIQRLMGQHSAQRPTHSDAWPSPCPRPTGGADPRPAQPARWHGVQCVSTHQSDRCSPGTRHGMAGGGATVAEVG
jgi:hypothetical protein